jgi:uncharacterized membrane protein YqjE
MAAIEPPTDPGLVSSLGRFSRSILAQVRMRLQLLGLELQEEKERIITALVAILLAYLFLSLTLALAAAAIVVHFWDTPNRMSALLWMAGCGAVAMLLSVALALSRLSRPSTLFHASLAELMEDETLLSDAALAQTISVEPHVAA